MKRNRKKDDVRAMRQALSAMPGRARPAKFVKRTNARKMPARIQVTQDQQVHILCPFCPQPHDIGVFPAVCGTKILVYATQEIHRGHKCALCGKEDGETVRIGSVYRCLVPCRNDMTVYTVPPKRSLMAAIVFKMPNALHLMFARKFGKVPVVLSRADGKIAGYAWQKAISVEKQNDQTASG